MAENQTASEDSGQQQQQQQQQQDQQQSQQQDSSPDQDSSSDSITPNPRSKTQHLRNSLTSIKVPRAMSSTSTEGTQQSQGSGKHHHHNHHHHHLHNNASSGHHGHHVIHRTTSESLRLGSDYPGSSNMTNSTSNSSSIHGGGSSSLATTTTNNSNSTTSNHSHSMSSSSSHSHSSHPHSHQHLPNSSGGPLQRKPKTSSFQITSVTVGNKLSSDNGDDSADDLDESHTDDNSRITDLENETPSVSEDTFSKEDVFFANNALSTTAPVIPTSAQYGLVVVDPIGPSVGQTIQNVQVNVADNIINVVSAVGNKKKPEVKETQHRSERFKVVKIESTEPFRRGRWMCMDYLDHSGNQALNKDVNSDKTISGSTVQAASGVSAITGEDPSRGATQTAIILTNDTGAAVANAGGGGGVENHIDAAAKLTADGNLNIYRSESQNSAGTGQNANQTVIHAQTLGGPMNLQQQQQQHQSQLPNQFQGQHFESGGHGQTMPLVTDFQQQQQQPPQHQQQQVNGNESSVAGQSQPASFFLNQLNTAAGNGGGGGVGGGGGSSASTTFQQQPQQSTPAHGVTLPANIHMQNGGGVGNGTSFQPVSYIPPSVAPSAVEIGGVSSATSVQQQQPSQQQQSSLVYVSQSGTSVAPQSYPSAANIVGGAAYTSAPVTHQLVNDSINTMQGTQQSDSNAATPSGSGQPQSQQQQQQPPQQQFQSMHPNPLAGQTMPILNQMTYDIQAQQQPTQAATNTPATISDPTAIAATIQQQQIDNNNFTTTNNNNNNNNKTASSSSTSAESSTTITGGGGGSGTSSSVSQPQQQAPSTSSSLSVAGSIQGSTSGGSAAATSTTGSTDDHQLHHNPETETESSASSLTHALANRRKRNSSIPQLPILAPIFNFNESTDPLNSTTEDTTGIQNIFTNLALGDDRYKLPNNRYPSDETINSLGDDAVTRSLPIPISGAGMFGRQTSYDVMAHSASPTTSTYPYSPFYYGSPSSPETLVQPLSISYDPRYEYTSNRLYVPTLMSQGRLRNDNDRLIRVIDGCGRSGLDSGHGKTSSATAAALAEGGAASVLNSASGTSAVAIDNKIEQAMDLVKSHLMIAVREEVEVLKEKISELMDKINQLEVENTILKANMSQETLHQLQLQAQLQIAGSGTGALIAQQPQQQSQPQQQQPATQQSQQPSQQQQAPQANPANTTNGPMS